MKTPSTGLTSHVADGLNKQVDHDECQGPRLVGVYGTEDGPRALFVRPSTTIQKVGLPPWWDTFIGNICDIPGRNSPDDEPEAMIATADELERCAINAMETHSSSQPQSVAVLKASRLYQAVNQMMGILGADGEVSPLTPEVRAVMAALEEIDGGAFVECRNHIDAERYRKARNQDIDHGFPRPGVFIGSTMPDRVLTYGDADAAIDAMPVHGKHPSNNPA